MKALLMFALVAMTLNASEALAGEDPKFTSNLNNWINNHMTYPSTAIENHEQGTVYVAFSVVDGKIEAEVVGSVSPELDSAALSVVRNIPVSDIDTQAQKSYILPIKFAIK